ncbi:MAG: hypothetical protein RI947_1417 [Candidatus Parcubacteria bacterium]|jgi:phosphoribosylformylglycinamidine synthase
MFESLHLEGKISQIWIADVYTIDAELPDYLWTQAGAVFSNPVIHTMVSYSEQTPIEDRVRSLSRLEPVQKGFSWSIEVGFLPGVTDNIGSTAREALEQVSRRDFNDEEGVYSSQITYINGDISSDDLNKVAASLANPLIQRISTKDFTSYIKDGGMDILVPKVRLVKNIEVQEVNLNIDDDELVRLGKSGIQNKDGSRRGPLALDKESMKAIQAYYKKRKRNPTDVELEAIAQTWSEHCKHTIFANPIDSDSDGLFKTYIKRATEEIRKKRGKKDICVSVFSDNSGGIRFDNKHVVTHKVETHNSPSALDPFGGAVTGIVGVNRDALGFGLGAKPVINTYGFCFSNPEVEMPLFRDKHLKDKMLSPRQIMEGVIAGVNAGGNCSGIPTPQGFMYFDDRYRGKPLVFVGTVGITPMKINGKVSYQKQARSGDYIVVIGGRVGLDGIHGATFSSETLDSGSPVSAVQIGDPITQKKLSDALIKEARDDGLYTSITDNGAGGLSCSVAEMAKESGGCFVYLDKIPLKYSGLDPWQIWISESQERMTLAVPKNNWPRFADLMRRRGVESTIIGLFTDSGKCIVEHRGKRIVNLDMSFLHEGFPKKHLVTSYAAPIHTEPHIVSSKTHTKILHALLQRFNIAGYEAVSSQYDHEVQGGSVTKPLQGKGRVNADATITKPVLTSEKGIALSQALYPSYGDIDMYHMTACGIDTAIRNIIAAGGTLDTIAILDNFCWCSPHLSQRLGELKRSLQACYDYAVAYGTPYISGKDSMYNDFRGFDLKGKPVEISIPPTVLISAIGIVADVKKSLTIDVKIPGDLIYILGETHDELGGSEYFAHYNAVGNTVPKVDVSKNKRLYKAFSACTRKGLIASAISVGRGGLAIALARMAMSGMMGVDIALTHIPGTVSRDDYALYSETQGRIVVTINPAYRKRFEAQMSAIPYRCIGKVVDTSIFQIAGKDKHILVRDTVEKLLQSYTLPFKNL